jgi:ribosomal protein S18 acetylase RimI-like enzyme
MKIRKANLKDLNELVKLDKVAHDEKSWWIPKSKREFDSVINNKKSFIIVCEENGNILGYLEAKLDNKKFSIENVYVKKNYRKKGIAAKLLNFFVSNKKPRAIELITSDDNLRLFERLGFRKAANLMRWKK